MERGIGLDLWLGSRRRLDVRLALGLRVVGFWLRHHSNPRRRIICCLWNSSAFCCSACSAAVGVWGMRASHASVWAAGLPASELLRQLAQQYTSSTPAHLGH